MTITILQGAFLPVPPLMGGAAEKMWFALGKEFAKRGNCVFHVSRLESSLPRHETIAGVQHIRVPGFDSPRSLVLLKLFDLVYTLRASCQLPCSDVIVTNTFWAPILLPFLDRGLVYVDFSR